LSYSDWSRGMGRESLARGLEASVKEELAIAFHAKDGGVDEGEGLAVEGADSVFNAVDGELVGGGVADDAAFAYVLAASFELRLDEEDGVSVPRFGCRGEGGEDGGEDESGRDEAYVHGKEGDGVWREREELAGGEEAGVGALKERDTGVGAELVVDLAVAGIDGEDGVSAALEHAVGEAAGGGADVGAGEAFDVDGPGSEGGFQFEASAGDEARVVAGEAKDGSIGDSRAGFVDLLFVDKDAAGDDHGLGALAGFGEMAIYEKLVETEFHEER
jgi:hypothetical protein